MANKRSNAIEGKALKLIQEIAEHECESDEWEGTEFFTGVVVKAQQFLKAEGIAFNNSDWTEE